MPHKPLAILLDIEGTTSSIAFVYDVMFPYAKEHTHSFLATHWSRTDVRAAIELVAKDAADASAKEWLDGYLLKDQIEVASRYLLELMSGDSKATGLKAIQGLVWESGFRSGELRSHLFPDVFPALQKWKQAGIRLGIYSSGSVVAQKLFFGHTEFGDLTPLFDCHYDTTTGGKRESASYTKIAQSWNMPPASIFFLTDVFQEWSAAREAGLQCTLVRRPGNAELPSDYSGDTIATFEELPF